MKRIWVLIGFLLSSPSARSDEWWAWSSLDLWRNENSKAWLFLGNRLDADDGAYVQIASPRFRQAIQPWLDLGIGLSLLSIEKTQTGERYTQFRPELEVNPHFELSPHLNLEWRNRIEWRLNEGERFMNHRLRNRLQLNWTLKEPCGPLTRFFVSNEFLADLNLKHWTENRLVPFGVTLKSSAHADLDLFYMVLSSRAHSAWQHESILGSYLRVRF